MRAGHAAPRAARRRETRRDARAGRAARARARSAAATQLGVARRARRAARPRRAGRARAPRAARPATPAAACRRSARPRSRGTRAPSAAASATVATIGTWLAGVRHDLVRRVCPACVRVDHRDDLALAVADQAVRGLAVRRVQRTGLGEDATRSLTIASGSTPEPSPGAARARCAPSSSAEALDGILGEISRWPSRSTKSQSEANCAAGGDAERALDHAAEHDDEAERAGRVHHAHGLADAAASWRA